MIIKCEQCETIYRFDSSQLPDGTDKVRCARCGNVFAVTPDSDLGEGFLNKIIETEQASFAKAKVQVQPATTPEVEPQPVVPQQEPPLHSPDSFQQDFDNTDEDDFWTSQQEFPVDDTSTQAQTAEPLAHESRETLPQAQKDIEEFIFEPMPEPHTTREPDAPRKEEVEPPSATPAPAPRRKKSRKTSKLLVFILLVLLGAGGAYFYYFTMQGATSMQQVISTIQEQINQLIAPKEEPPSPTIRIQTNDNFYIENNTLGTLFAINGKVTNISKQPQGEIAVMVTLYARNGSVISSQKVFCGNPISKETLRVESLESIRDNMNNKLGAGLSNVSLQTNESLPFTAVFHNLPDNFSEFSVSEITQPAK